MGATGYGGAVKVASSLPAGGGHFRLAELGVLSEDDEDVRERFVVAGELAGVSGEAERAMRHLGLGAWTSMLVEADRSVVAMTPAPLGSLLVVAASRETPVGLVRLLLDRALTRARDWLSRVA